MEENSDKDKKETKVGEKKSVNFVQKVMNTNPGNFTHKSTLLCRFCGGKKCPKELASKNPYENALEGVHSDWITDNILATQRLSTRLLKEFDVVKQLKMHGVKAVFNLQEPGEHPYCGDGLEKLSGFTYNPDDIIEGGIYFFNFNWVDMTVTDEKTIMKLMDLMDFIVNKQYGKFLVHCHAGTGRTGLAIASWLIYNHGYTAEDAIKQFQQRRKGGLSKSKQHTFLKNFEKYVKDNKRCFNLEKPLKMEDIIDRQKKVTLQGFSQKSNNIPIILETTLQDLLRRVEKQQNTVEQVLKAFYNPDNQQIFTTPYGYYLEGDVEKLKSFYDKGLWNYAEGYDLRVICQVLLDFFDSLLLETINSNSIELILEKQLKQKENLEQIFLEKQILQIFSIYEFSVLNKIIYFLIQLQEISQNQIEEDLIIQFLRRLGFSLYLIKDEKIRQQCLEKCRFYKPEEFEKIDNNYKIKKDICNFSELLCIWYKQAIDQNSEFDQQLFEKSYLRAYNIAQQALKEQKKLKNQKKVIQDPLPDRLDTLVVGKYKKDLQNNSQKSKSEQNNNNNEKEDNQKQIQQLSENQIIQQVQQQQQIIQEDTSNDNLQQKQKGEGEEINENQEQQNEKQEINL